MVGRLTSLYEHSLALLTDLYQLTMAAGYFQCGLAEREAVFHLSFRQCPFGGAYTIACGLADAVDFIERFRFTADDVAYLSSVTGSDHRPLFRAEFLEYLRAFRLRCDIDAMPEGTLAFPHEPMMRVRGPLVDCQLLETPLLTLMNFPTLVATKAARICDAAQGEPVIEFGLRRAQGIDGGITAARAAFVGGCVGTSNVLAGKLFEIPIRGTHAHSWVMAFDQELEAFRTYATAMPNNCIFLVDTYDTLAGVHNAVEVGRELRAAGSEMVGIRLDSGELVELSIAARQILDAGGFPDAVILASNDLDEHAIAGIKERGGVINVWGVGTKLTTAYDQPALGGVYKLAAIAGGDGQLQPRMKLSEDVFKMSTPGVQGIRRFSSGGKFVGDVIYDEELGIDELPAAVYDFHGERFLLPDDAVGEDLLRPIFRGGHLIGTMPDLHAVQSHARRQLAALPESMRRLARPRPYPVGLEPELAALKQRMIGRLAVES